MYYLVLLLLIVVIILWYIITSRKEEIERYDKNVPDTHPIYIKDPISPYLSASLGNKMVPSFMEEESLPGYDGLEETGALYQYQHNLP